MTLSAVLTRYAEALADVVTASGSALRPQQALSELQLFVEVLRSSPELHNALTTPAVPGSRKRTVVARIGGELGISTVTRNFLFVLIDHRRIGALPEIVETLGEVLDQRLGFARAEIASAREMTDRQRAELNAELEQLTGKRLRLRFRVDAELVGGVVARIGSTVYDGSVRGQLRSLERRLMAED